MNVRGLVALALLALAMSLPARAAPAPGRWDEVLPFAPAESRLGAGVDARGTAWVLTDKALRYWDGAGFRTLQVEPFKESNVRPKLVGGPDRGLFLVADGKVYAVSTEGIQYVADYYTGPGAGAVYVAADGRLMQWGRTFLTPDLKRPSTRREARFGDFRTPIWDDGPRVHLLYGGRLYTAGPDGTVTEQPCELMETKRWPVTCVPWGPGKALALQHRHLFGIDTDTGELFDVQALADAVGGQDAVSLLAAMPDGSCLLKATGPHKPIFRARPGSPPEALPNSAAIPSGFSWQFGEPATRAVGKDGSLWTTGYGHGLLEYKDGVIRTWGWRDGIRIGRYSNVLMDGAGTVFAVDPRGVYVFRPDGSPPPLPAGYALWTEVPTEHWPKPDFEGGLWARLSDRPGRVSHWDGRGWHDVEVPFDATAAYTYIPDDRGHLLAAIYDEDGRCYDLGPHGVRRYDSVQAALQAAVADGARRFRGDSLFPCICTDEKGRIWFGQRFPNKLHYFDGAQWHVADLPYILSEMHRSAQHGITAYVAGRLGLYTWPGGPQPLQARRSFAPSGRMLLGPTGFQPFEEELLRAEPADYLPVERQDNQYTLLRAQPTPGGVRYVPGDTVTAPGDTTSLPAPTGGLWLMGARGGPYRILAGRAIRCDFSDTPLRGAAASPGVFEDRAHNVWTWGPATFMKRLAGFRVRLGQAPAKVGRALSVDVALDLPGLAPGRGYVFWRVDSGPWRGGGPPGETRLRFTTNGMHRVEFLGMDTLGGTTPRTASLSVEATMPLPDTRLSAQGPFTLDDVTWRPPVEAVPSWPGEAPKLEYRLDGAQWQPLRDAVLLHRLAPGAHEAEFAAVEEGKYRDASPVRVEFTYAPDFERIVGRRLDALLGPDPIRAAAALRELKAAGPGVVDALRRRLERIRQDAAAAGRLEQLMEWIKEDQEPEPQPARPSYGDPFHSLGPPARSAGPPVPPSAASGPPGPN